MNGRNRQRIALLSVQAFVAVTALAGGVALVVGSVAPDLATVLNPPTEYLEGSAFSSYLVPGLVLALVLGGSHAVAFAVLLRRAPSALFVAAAAGYVTLIWIFVQMIVIPFSFLQAVYFAAGGFELGLVLLLLGLVRGPLTMSRRARRTPGRRPCRSPRRVLPAGRSTRA